MDKLKKLSNYFVVFILIILTTSVNSKNNIKIIFDVENDIITNVDIKNEYKYLLIINESFSKLNEQQGLEIAKNNAIKEKVRRNEIKKRYKLNENYELIDNIILDYFKNFNLVNKDQIIEFIKDYDLEYNFIQKKFETEQIWKELIVFRYSNKVNIDEKAIRERLNKKKLSKINSFFLREILFELKDNENLNEKIILIKKNILEKGFEVSATLHSVSSTSNIGGKIGWINENQLNKTLLKKVKKLKINDVTEPIKISSGYLILKVENRKEIDQTKNIDSEIKKIVLAEKNRQLIEFADIFFEKLKINTYINER
jgi:peptidyl-prolyl cis-trans isomerase SurA